MEKITLDNLNHMEFEEILKTKQELEEYVDVIDEYVITSKTDLDGIITYSSKAFEKISGYFENELIGKHHSIVRHPDMSDQFFKNMWETIKQKKTWTGEIKNLKKDGTAYWVNMKITPNYDHHGNHIGYTAVKQDITDRKHLEMVTYKDKLTGLYNRLYYNEHIQKEINRAIRDKKVFLYFILDIDYFKKYNDNYGQREGDKVLKQIADFFQKYFKRATDSIFRLGGEEFCIIYTTDTDMKGLKLAESLCRAIENLNIKHEFSDISDHLTVSIGLAICNFQSKKIVDIESNLLYEKADKALANAKQLGRNQVHTVHCTMENFL